MTAAPACGGLTLVFSSCFPSGIAGAYRGCNSFPRNDARRGARADSAR